MAFGGSGGYVHLWTTSATPRVNMVSQPLDFPTPTAKPPRLTEQDFFALPFPYGASQVCLSVLPCVTGVCLLPMVAAPTRHGRSQWPPFTFPISETDEAHEVLPAASLKESFEANVVLTKIQLLLLLQTKLLSDFSFPAPIQMRQPPRVIPPALLKDVRQVEFVGYVANPMYKRGAAPGEATKAVAALRNARHQPKQATLDAAATTTLARHASMILLSLMVCAHTRACSDCNPIL